MKRKIVIGMILVMLSHIIVLSASSAGANLPVPEIMPAVPSTSVRRPTSSLYIQSQSVCECGCDTFMPRCSEVETYSKGRHPVMWGGYMKTCEYNIHSVYTIYECSRCGSRTVQDVHAHGESDHTYPFICGGKNERICSLDGQVYSITPMDELTPVYEPIE